MLRERWVNAWLFNWSSCNFEYRKGHSVLLSRNKEYFFLWYKIIISSTRTNLQAIEWNSSFRLTIFWLMHIAVFLYENLVNKLVIIFKISNKRSYFRYWFDNDDKYFCRVNNCLVSNENRHHALEYTEVFHKNRLFHFVRLILRLEFTSISVFFSFARRRVCLPVSIRSW